MYDIDKLRLAGKTFSEAMLVWKQYVVISVTTNLAAYN